MLVSPRASGVCCCPCLRLTHTIIYISFGFPRMDVFYLGRFRPRHVHRPSAAHSRSGGEVHVCRKVWQTRKVTIRTRYWLYSQPSFAAPTINWSWRGSYSAGYALLHSRVHTQSGALRLAMHLGNIILNQVYILSYPALIHFGSHFALIQLLWALNVLHFSLQFI